MMIAEVVYVYGWPCLVKEETKDEVVLINHVGKQCTIKKANIKRQDDYLYINEPYRADDE